MNESESEQFENDNSVVYHSTIANMVFYVKSEAEIRQDSVVTVLNKEIMKGDKPVPSGIYDAHMGTTDYAWRCQTCRGSKKTCPGHFGSIELKHAVKSPMFRQELLKWLKIICYHCSSIVVRHDKADAAPPSQRISTLMKYIKPDTKCQACALPHMRVVADKQKTFIFWRETMEGKRSTEKREYFNHDIARVLSKISLSDVKYLGQPAQSHPMNYVLKVIPVPPNPVRPDIKRIGGSRSSNSDTTQLLKTIMEVNENLPDETPPLDQINQSLKDTYNNLDLTYYSMVKGGGGGDVKIVTNTSKPPMAIAERLVTKKGRVRLNLMGKRVKMMIRSVIVGDAQLRIDQVGIPKRHAMTMTIPSITTAENYEQNVQYFNNGPNVFPGCLEVIKGATGHTFRRDRMPSDYKLEIGDTVMRHMMDGDHVLFNRQPSLLPSNMSGMEVKIMNEGDTLRINPSVCNLYNADFDGDQMNVIVSQSYSARNECRTILSVGRRLISPQNHAPLVGAFQDGLIGIFEMSKEGLVFNKWHAMQMFGQVIGPVGEFTKKLYNNREVISRVIPKINMIGKTPSYYKEQYADYIKYNPKDIKLNIVRGELQSGVLDKASVGQGVAGSLVHIVANEYGSAEALKFVYNMQQIVHPFLLHKGFTVGIMDTIIRETARKDLDRKLEESIAAAGVITQQLNDGKFIAPLGVSLRDHYEEAQLNALSSGDDFANPILADIDINTNQILGLTISGSKGKMSNIIALNGAIGVQTINGERFKDQAGWGRTSIYFTRYDMSPESKGFISMAFNAGVDSQVYGFMAAEARYGQISNALSTSVTGHQNRISIKNLESLVSDNTHKSVKSTNVNQPLVYENGIDPSKLEKVRFPTIDMSDAKFEAEFRSKPNDFGGIVSHQDIDKVIKREEKKREPAATIAPTAAAARPATNIGSDIMDDIRIGAGGSGYGERDIDDEIEWVQDNGNSSESLSEMLDSEFEQIKRDREFYRRVHMELEDSNPKAYVFDTSKQMPVNIPRIIDDIIYDSAAIIDSLPPSERKLDPKYVIGTVRNLCHNIGYVFLNDTQRVLGRPLPKYIVAASRLMRVLIRSYLSTGYLRKKKAVNKHIEFIVQKIILMYKRSLLDAGTAIGIIAAQCVCEKFTQYVLDSKHRTGGQGGTKTNAIVRTQEILGVKSTEKMKNPHMMISVKHEYENDRNRVQEIANHIEMMSFGQFISDIRVFFEEFGKPTHPEWAHESKDIAEFKKHNFGTKMPYALDKWCIRVGLNKKEMILKSMKLETIVRNVRGSDERLFVMYTPENADDTYLRIYFTSAPDRGDYMKTVILPTIKSLKNVIVRGVKGIISAAVVDVTKHVKEPDGSLSVKKVYAINTTGTNLVDILANPFIDPYRTQSDSIEETEKVFGLMAARQKISNEMISTLDELNRMHCSIFADEMCFSGVVSNIQRTGLQTRENSNVTLRLSFQNTVQVIQNAAINGLVDKISGISGPLIVGTIPRIGTSYNTIVVNRKFIQEQAASAQAALAEL